MATISLQSVTAQTKEAMEAAFAFLSAHNSERSQWPFAMRAMETMWQTIYIVLDRPVENEDLVVQWLYSFSYKIKDTCHCTLNTMYWDKDALYDDYIKLAQTARMSAMMLAYRWQ
jgi:hypothetical protein